MRKIGLSVLVVLLAVGLVTSVIPATTVAVSVQETSGSSYLKISGDAETSNYGDSSFTPQEGQNPPSIEIFAAPLHRNVTVYRDSWGVPHIYAQETSDAYYALGYVMAQDRLFEMDIFRRTTAGRLSELFGPATLEQDILMRTLGIYKIAIYTWYGVYGPISPDIRENLWRFSCGVNRYIANLRPRAPGFPDLVPVEYRALNASLHPLPWNYILPYPWTPIDSVAIAGMMGLMLTDSSEAEIIRGAFAGMVDPIFEAQGLPGITDFLMPTGWINMTTIMPPGCSGFEGLSEITGVTDPLKELLGFSGPVGSNNWVIDDLNTTTGYAMLANDPHLNLQFPGINWQVHVKTDEYNVIGCCIPGGPAIYTGHNDYFAFGVTNLMADVLDLYYYKFNVPDNPTAYWYIDHWEPLKVRFETIFNIITPVRIPVVSTRHGPLITTPLPPPFNKMAFRWAGREAGYGEIVGFSEMASAKNLAEWRQALTHMTVIIQNFVYADKEGNIAWSPSGAIPIRDPRGVPTMGVVPSNGSAGQNEWLGWIPRATSPVDLPWDPWPFPISLPYCENPDQGFIATANNQPIGPDYPGYPWPVWIGPAYTYAPGYRAQRITELIEFLAPLNITEMAWIQGDSLSIPARNFVPYILWAMHGDTNATIQQALWYLANWDRRELRNSIAALIFEVWYDMYEQNTFADEFGPVGLFPFPNMIIPLWNMTQTWWWNPYAIVLFDDKTTPSTCPGQPGWEFMPDIINASLHDAIDWIASQLGSNMSEWQYGRLHVVQFEHVAMGDFLPYLNIPPVPPFGVGPVPCDGGPYTVDPGGHHHKLIVEQAYLYVESGASYRGIYECKDDWDTSLILVPPGESGLVTGSPFAPIFNPHCADTFVRWQNNWYTPCLFNDTIIQTTYEMEITFYGMKLWGDVNDDGVVDILDLILVIRAFGSRLGDPRWNERADLNGDGSVNIIDVIIVVINWRRSYLSP